MTIENDMKARYEAACDDYGVDPRAALSNRYIREAAENGDQEELWRLLGAAVSLGLWPLPDAWYCQPGMPPSDWY